MVVINMNKVMIIFVLVASVYAGNALDEFLAPLTQGQKCANPIDAYDVTSFTVTPWPPTRRTKITSTSVGTFNQAETITGIKVTVYLDGKSFYTETVPESGTYAAGQSATFTYAETVPFIAPKGNYTIKGGLVNSSGTQVSCWEVSFSLN